MGRWVGGGRGGGSAREKNDFNSASVCLLVPLLVPHLQDIMNSEKSYDSLPNFTAADCEFAFVVPRPSQ